MTASDTFMLTVTAVNDAPTISDIADQTIDEDTADQRAARSRSAMSRPPRRSLDGVGQLRRITTLVPDANIVFGGAGANRTVTVTPAANQIGGPITITVTVSDGTATASDTFMLTVTAVNDAPTISDIADQTIDEDTATSALAFTVGDAETAAAA